MRCHSSIFYSVGYPEMHGKTTSIYTKNYCDDYPEYTLKLLKTADFIHNIIINKEEYKELTGALLQERVQPFSY